MIRIVAYAVAAIVATLTLRSISARLMSYESQQAVMIFGAVLGVINAFIKPVLKVLTLPLSCLTFGLFAIVLNAGLFYAGASVTPGITITLWGAVLGSIIASVASGIIFSVVDER